MHYDDSSRISSGSCALFAPELDNRKRVVYIDLHMVTYTSPVGGHRRVEANWMSDPCCHGYEMALKPGAEDLLSWLRMMEYQPVCITDRRFGTIQGLRQKLSALGIKRHFLGGVSLPNPHRERVRFADEAFSPELLRKLSNATSARTILVAPFGVGAHLLELCALGIISRDQCRRYSQAPIGTMPSVMAELGRRFVGAFVSEEVEDGGKRLPIRQQWDKVGEEIMLKMTAAPDDEQDDASDASLGEFTMGSDMVSCGFGDGRDQICKARCERQRVAVEGWAHGHCDLDLCDGVWYCPEHKGVIYRGKSESHWPCNYDPADDALGD